MPLIASVVNVNQWVQDGGLAIIFVLMTLQCIGVPFPSEVIMPLAGYLASTGSLNLAAAIGVGTAGNVVGSLIAYGLAAWLGEPVLLGPGRYIGIRRDHVESADRWFRRHGRAAVMVGRLLPVVRTYISFPAGLARVPLGEFTLFTLLGTLPWCAALGVAGWVVGKSWDRVSGPISAAGLGLAVLLALVVVIWFVRGRRRRSSAQVAGDLPEAGTPGERETVQ